MRVHNYPRLIEWERLGGRDNSDESKKYYMKHVIELEENFTNLYRETVRNDEIRAYYGGKDKIHKDEKYKLS